MKSSVLIAASMAGIVGGMVISFMAFELGVQHQRRLILEASESVLQDPDANPPAFVQCSRKPYQRIIGLY